MNFIGSQFDKLIYDLSVFSEQNPTKAAWSGVGCALVVALAIVGIKEAVKWYGQEERFLVPHVFFNYENKEEPSNLEKLSIEDISKSIVFQRDLLKVKKFDRGIYQFQRDTPNFNTFNRLLPYLKNLEKISLRFTQLNDLPPNLKTSKVKELDISLNPELKNFSNLPFGLEKLKMGNLQLTTIPDLKSFNKLKTLDLKRNQLEGIDDVTNLPQSLEELNLSKNLFRSGFDCKKLKESCPKLQTLKIDAFFERKLENKEVIPTIVITDKVLESVTNPNVSNQKDQ